MKAKADFLALAAYRLPTEVEWEYACRAGTRTSRYYGVTKSLLPHYAYYLENSLDRTWPVAALKPNDLGLFDMLGNVTEWCQSRYRSYGGTTRDLLQMPAMDVVLDDTRRVARGGAFFDPPKNVRQANAGASYRADTRGEMLGFRLARTYP